MRKLCTLVLLLIFCFAIVAIPEASVVRAEVRTIVVPDDYPTMEEAVVHALDGDIVFVRSGTYEGAINQTLVLGKSISFIGENPKNTNLILKPRYVEPNIPFTYPYYENAITIQANNVRLSNFTISSIGGMIVTKGYGIEISNNILKLGLHLSGSYENIFRNNSTSHISCYGPNKNISNNIVMGGAIAIGVGYKNNSINYNVVFNGNGIGVMGIGNRIFNNSVENCSIGIRIAGDSSTSSNLVYNNLVYNNTIGLSVFCEGSNNVLYNNYVVNNGFGAEVRYYFPVGENNTLYHNNFVNNTVQVNADPTIILSDSGEWTAYHSGFFDNGKEGNYWSDYNGIDSDGDGIGDTPYMIDDKRTDHYPLMEPVDINVITEFPSWIILPLFLIATFSAIIIRKRVTNCN